MNSSGLKDRCVRFLGHTHAPGVSQSTTVPVSTPLTLTLALCMTQSTRLTSTAGELRLHHPLRFMFGLRDVDRHKCQDGKQQKDLTHHGGASKLAYKQDGRRPSRQRHQNAHSDAALDLNMSNMLHGSITCCYTGTEHRSHRRPSGGSERRWSALANAHHHLTPERKRQSGVGPKPFGIVDEGTRVKMDPQCTLPKTLGDP